MAYNSGTSIVPVGHQPDSQAYPLAQQQQAANSSNEAVQQLFARISQEIEEHKPKNCIHFIVDFLCKHYPEHLHGFASIWQMDPDLERERHEVVNFFKAHKISTAVAAHFTNAGYDTLDTLTTLSPDSLVDVEAFNNVKWLPGHKVRLQQIFGEISARIRAYKQQYGNAEAGRRGHVHRPSSPHVHRHQSPHLHRPLSPHGHHVSSHQTHHMPSYVHHAPTAPIVHNADYVHHMPSAPIAPTANSTAFSTPLNAGLPTSYTPSLMAPAGLGHAVPSLQAPGNMFLPNHYTVA